MMFECTVFIMNKEVIDAFVKYIAEPAMRR